jgi:[FeFe] hydrogenase H-cluster maturation GTPase HydF
VLVVPIDKEAPKGRLILPQVQSIRDLLDGDAYCLVVKDSELKSALDSLKRPPKLVVTDSQAFLKVAADTPRDIPMTGFSILFARFKGDLTTQVLGATAIEDLRPGDRVLVAEACSHHPIEDDIGRVKIPRWLMQYVGGELAFDTVQGHDFPEDLSPYRLAILCGSCMVNRREVLSRILRCREAGVPVTNYGLTIAYSLGIFERALEPFPAALEAYRGAGEHCPQMPQTLADEEGRNVPRRAQP